MSTTQYILSLKTEEDGTIPIAVLKTVENLKEQICALLNSHTLQNKFWKLREFARLEYPILNCDEYFQEHRLGWSDTVVQDNPWFVSYELNGVLRCTSKIELLITPLFC
jgi:hypothetical protein